MMSFQSEQRDFGKTHRWQRRGQGKGFPLDRPATGRIPPGRASAVAPEPLPPFSDLVEIDCQDCGGKGYDPGSVSMTEPEDCTACQGSGKEMVFRNYLAEAFRIAADPKTNVQLERAHVVALTAYARQTVNALMMSSQEVA